MKQALSVVVTLIILGIIVYIMWMELKATKLKVKAAETDLSNTKRLFDLLKRIEGEFAELDDKPAAGTNENTGDAGNEKAEQTNESNITQDLKIV